MNTIEVEVYRHHPQTIIVTVGDGEIDEEMVRVANEIGFFFPIWDDMFLVYLNAQITVKKGMEIFVENLKASKEH